LVNERVAKDKEIKSMKVDDKKANELDAEIAFKEQAKEEAIQKYSLKGADIAKSASDADLEDQERKKISHVENSELLGKILKEAVAEGNQGLISAVSKKMTKVGDYNEMQKVFGLGTGRKGMQDLADKFQYEGGMTEQSALALIAEIGNIAKGVNHFGAFGAVGMKDGQWVKAEDDEYEQAQLAEMLKMEPQAFVRNVNRLGLGYYENEVDGNQQKTDNWHISKAATAYLKLNGNALNKQYADRGQQNAMEHLWSQKEVLKKNIDPALLNTIEGRTKTGKGKGADVADIIKQIKA